VLLAQQEPRAQEPQVLVAHLHFLRAPQREPPAQHLPVQLEVLVLLALAILSKKRSEQVGRQARLAHRRASRSLSQKTPSRRAIKRAAFLAPHFLRCSSAASAPASVPVLTRVPRGEGDEVPHRRSRSAIWTKATIRTPRP